VEKLEERWKEVDLEWSDWYGKFRLLYQRISKRAKALEGLEAREETAGALHPGGNVATPGGSHLTPGQQRIQDQILARRGGILPRSDGQ